MASKNILLIFPPRDQDIRSIHLHLYNGLKSLDNYNVDYLEFHNPPKFENKELIPKFINIYQRIVRNNKKFIYIAEKAFLNKYFLEELSKFKSTLFNKKYDYILIIKPEEFSDRFLKSTRELTNKQIGYMWDALRLYFKPSLKNNKKYFDHLYSFDKNEIELHKDLQLSYLTNYYIDNGEEPLPYNDRPIDVFYIGAITDERRDITLGMLSNVLRGKKIFYIKIPQKSSQFMNNIDTIKDINYITEALPINKTLTYTKRSKIIIDICKSQHVGLSFRFFEALFYKTKIITNNPDIINYDFYHPNNILYVDFHNIENFHQKILDFQNTKYCEISDKIVEKYSLENWAKKVFE